MKVHGLFISINEEVAMERLRRFITIEIECYAIEIDPIHLHSVFPSSASILQ